MAPRAHHGCVCSFLALATGVCVWSAIPICLPHNIRFSAPVLMSNTRTFPSPPVIETKFPFTLTYFMPL